MRILVALPYGPSQTRVRSRMILGELARHHDVVLVALAWDEEDREAIARCRALGIETHTIAHGRLARAAALPGVPRQPLQQVASSSGAFARRARRLIADADIARRPFRAVHIEHLRGGAAIRLTDRLGARVVYDAVDCLADLARHARQSGPGRIVRGLAAIEEGRTRRLETAYVAASDATTVVAERDRVGLLAGGAPDRISVVPNGVNSLAAPVSLTRQPVAIFTGKLSYHANQAALRWLLADIWPRVLAALPEARMVIAGADPPRWLGDAAHSMGAKVVADPPEMAPLIAGARVAVAPIVYSVGVQNKVLESMACGVPVVATPSAAAGLPPAAAGTFCQASEPDAFARQIVRLLREPSMAEEYGRAGHSYVRQHHSWARVVEHFEDLYLGDGNSTGAAPAAR